MEKQLNIINQEELKDKVSDVEIFGKDLFKCVSKTSSKSQGWMKSTKICNLPYGMLVQVTTQQNNNIAEALQYVPNIKYDFETEEFYNVISQF